MGIKREPAIFWCQMCVTFFRFKNNNHLCNSGRFYAVKITEALSFGFICARGIWRHVWEGWTQKQITWWVWALAKLRPRSSI
jgi:hypothetical protein